MSDLKTIRQQCKDFAKLHLAECCAEIMEWQDTAILRDGKVRELAAMAGSFIGNHDTLRVAESFINRAAIEAATAAPTDAKADGLSHPYHRDLAGLNEFIDAFCKGNSQMIACAESAWYRCMERNQPAAQNVRDATSEELGIRVDVHNAALEMAAKICDEQAKEPECPERAQYCAQAIRAQKGGAQ